MCLAKHNVYYSSCRAGDRLSVRVYNLCKSTSLADLTLHLDVVRTFFPLTILFLVLDLRSLPAFLFVSGLMLGPENTSAFNRSVFATT
jgi:hypothetical protein